MTQMVLNNNDTRIDTTPMALLSSAIDKGLEVETLERLMALQERWLEQQAHGAFGAAMAAFQADMPPVHKGRQADRFSFAGFDDIMKVASPILSKHQISVAFDTKHEGDGLTVTCRVRVAAYYEDRTFTVPVASSLKVSEPQQYGATLAYAKRYALCAALNIVVTDEDTEKITKPITTAQVKELHQLIKETGTETLAFLDWAGCEDMSELSERQYEQGARKLRKKKLDNAKGGS